MQEINGTLYMPLSRRLGRVPTGLGLSCRGLFALTLTSLPGTLIQAQPRASSGCVRWH